jgi:hypothetical protein
MATLADGFIALPGGFGTVDELAEALTWTQLGLQAKPVVLLDVEGFWAPRPVLRRRRRARLRASRAPMLLRADGDRRRAIALATSPVPDTPQQVAGPRRHPLTRGSASDPRKGAVCTPFDRRNVQRNARG